MSQFAATAVLRAEHDNILKMIAVAERAAERVERGTPVDQHVLTGLVEVFGVYADRRHHAKEEQLLFPALQRMGMPGDGGPIGVMLMEHDHGRAHVREMRAAAAAHAAGEDGAGTRWAQAAWGFAGLLREHIEKENEILFVMAERMLGPEQQADLAAAFARADQDQGGEAEGARLMALMASLEGALV